jgi:tetrahydromethanopterin S-methyltransferase subunit G
MLRQLLDAIDADDYETIKKILDTIERSVNNE